MAAVLKMNSNRYGLNRQITGEGAGVYRWAIRKGDDVVSAGIEPTLADARRVVRSTTAFLAR